MPKAGMRLVLLCAKLVFGERGQAGLSHAYMREKNALLMSVLQRIRMMRYKEATKYMPLASVQLSRQMVSDRLSRHGGGRFRYFYKCCLKDFKKKILLSFIACCVFSAHGIAANSDAKLKRIERIEKKINALKAERTNIRKKQSPIMDEMGIYIKTAAEFENKTKIPATFSEKAENDIKGSRCVLANMKLQLDISKIDLNIDKANIELIKAEIKAGKTPKIPLELAKAALKFTKSTPKAIEAGNKLLQARIKENETKIKYLEAAVKEQEETKKRDAKDSHIRSIEVAEFQLAETMLKVKLLKAREETSRACTNETKACVKLLCKPLAELRKTYLKFDKAVDEKNFISFLRHE
jgi:hypothetical protein